MCYYQSRVFENSNLKKTRSVDHRLDLIIGVALNVKVSTFSLRTRREIMEKNCINFKLFSETQNFCTKTQNVKRRNTYKTVTYLCGIKYV